MIVGTVGTVGTIVGMLRLKSDQLSRIEWFSGQTRQSRKDAFLGLALKIANSANRSFIFTRSIVQNNAGPVTWCEFCLTDELNHSRFDAVDVYALSDDEAIRVGS